MLRCVPLVTYPGPPPLTVPHVNVWAHREMSLNNSLEQAKLL
jgi:hypothetical protein